MEVSALMQTSVMLLCGGQGGCESAALQTYIGSLHRSVCCNQSDCKDVIGSSVAQLIDPYRLSVPHLFLFVYSLHSRVELCK